MKAEAQNKSKSVKKDFMGVNVRPDPRPDPGLMFDCKVEMFKANGSYCKNVDKFRFSVERIDLTF